MEGKEKAVSDWHGYGSDHNERKTPLAGSMVFNVFVPESDERRLERVAA
jgi:hypothetical protein